MFLRIYSFLIQGRDYDFIDYDDIKQLNHDDYPRYVKRPIPYKHEILEISEPTPPPKEIEDAINLLNRYMEEGDAAMESLKTKVLKYHCKIIYHHIYNS